MIDNIQIKTSCTDDEFLKLTEKISVDAPINSEKIKFDYANLRGVYYPNINKLTLTNSWHKFYNLEFGQYHASVNHNDFSFSNFYTVADFLSEWVLEKAFTDLHISSKYEFGLNINTDFHQPFNLISKYQSCILTHANEFFTVPPYSGKPIQRSCYFSDWYIKAYDKGLQAGVITTNLLRFEIVVTELRKLRNILKVDAVSIADIVTIQAWDNMFNFLIATYDAIRKIPEIENTQPSLDDINAFYSYCNKLKRSDIQKSTTRYYFEQLNKGFKKVYEQYNTLPENYHNTIRKKMYDTYERLMGRNQANFNACNEE